MIKKIIYRLCKKLTKVTVAEAYNIDGTPYKVIDRTNPLPFIKNTRDLSFMHNGRVYSQSSIHTDTGEVMQPAYIIPQTTFKLWAKTSPVKNALVLGCGGCTIPRFITLGYPEVSVTGIELSKELIDIAKKYFIAPQTAARFTLIQGDAIEYIFNYNLPIRQDFIFLDIFCDNQVVPQAFTTDYINALYKCTSDNSLIVFNLLGKEPQIAQRFADSIDLPFDFKKVVAQNNALFLIMARAESKESIKDFETAF